MTQAFPSGSSQAYRAAVATVCTALLLGCDAAGPVAGLAEPEISHQTETAPPGAAPGTCWGKIVSPATIETVTEQILLQPAELSADGQVRQPAVYKTETRQEIVRPRQDTWFETPCDADLTPEFISSLQRALQARGLYRGGVTGAMDARTRAAVRQFQLADGLDSGILSVASARKLGLIAVELPARG